MLKYILVLLAGTTASLTALCQDSFKKNTDREWILRSNSYTQKIIEVDEKYNPVFGSQQGVAYFDTLISIPTLANELSERKDKEAVLSGFKTARQSEKSLPVRQDLDILIYHTELDFRQEDYTRNKEVTYYNPSADVYDGIKVLLDDQTPENRRAAAVQRLRKYAGVQNGYAPLADILKARTTQQMSKANMVFPSKQEMEIALSRNASLVNGMADLYTKYKITGWEEPYRLLKKQLEDYDTWIKSTLLPKGRTDYRLAPEQYMLNLESYGIDIPPAQISRMAHDSFTSIQEKMKPIAERLAKKYHLSSTDYRDVIRFLKKDQLIGDTIMKVYLAHLADIEAIIRKNRIVSLPDRAAIIKLSTAAEAARQPAPHMVPPPFLNNTGQRGVFVLPLTMPTAPGEKEDRYDDFTFDAASWTIIAHEVRPGHEMQFDKMVEEGVSQARALYAFNSTNVEGWGLYSEYLILPYMPEEGQLVSLDYRLLRSARAFLDPELQAGTITPQQALDLLMKDVVSSHAFAQQEVERYTVRAPGQANSYFYGYTKMIGLRKDTEKTMAGQFDQLRFHDFILAQGILPPALIRQAVMTELVGGKKQP